MKKVLLLAFLASFTASFAQLNDIKKNGLYVVLEDDEKSEYNKMIQEAVKKYWHISEIKYATKAEFNSTLRGKMGNVFLVKLIHERDLMDEPGNSVSEEINLVSYDKSWINKNNKTGEIVDRPGCGLDISYQKVRKNGNVIFKRQYILTLLDYKLMVEYFQNNLKSGLAGFTVQCKGEIEKSRNDVMNRKIFVISETEMTKYGLEEEKVKKSYKNPFEVVTDARLTEIIEKRDPKYVYLRSRPLDFINEKGEKATWKDNEGRELLVIDAESGFLLYAMYRTVKEAGLGNLGAFRR